ncbi:MAG: diguanylate cyclase [Armatimonadetes bacterium]|nr:diguanylate cyclase [Armatimonadota bacterium]
MAERVRLAIEAVQLDYGSVTASLGVTCSANHALEELLRQADTALYRAKALGRNQVQAL